MLRLASICALVFSGCFTPSHQQCAVTCGANNSCPSGLTCLSDGFCHESAADSLCGGDGDGDIDASVDAPPACGDGVRDSSMSEECDDGNRDDGDGCSAICREESGFVCVGDNGMLSTCRPNPSEAGQLVITEALINPSGATDLTHEWFEVHNPTNIEFDLQDMRATDDGIETFTVNRSLVIPAGGHVVFGRNDDMANNGGAPVDFAYGAAYALSNGSSDAIEIDFAGVVIDRITTSVAPPDGASASLSAQTYDAVSNDMLGNFCDAVDSFGDNGDLGTPGAMNPDCP